ncbi:hypothetical protein [Stenotrophomonas nematodicola]|uniref:hypothetical protein n=1 Tax=Stenotrophomonas nematodicola TaxID=2656746 RepID=UPI003D9A0D18
MSYDVMVFDPAAAPREVVAFIAWFERQAEWNEDHDYDDASVSAPALQAWYADITTEYPPMNGPLADDDDDRPQVTDYSVGRQVIYAAFAHSVAEHAHGRVQELAHQHGLGFFDVSGDGAIVYPDGTTLIPA